MSLTNILSLEMNGQQMQAFAGAARGKGATGKDEVLLAVLVTLGTKGKAALEKLPAAAQRKIKAAPSATRELERIRSASAK